MKPSPPRHPLGWLSHDPAFREVGERVDRLLALQEDLQRCVASIEVVAMGIENESLLVGTAGAAAAAKLRQIEPSIVAALRNRGWQVRHVKFRPRSRGTIPAPIPMEPRADIPPAALAEFAILRDQASSEALEQALTNLLRRHTRR